MFRLHVKYQKSAAARAQQFSAQRTGGNASGVQRVDCLLYTSDAADEL